MPIVLFFQIVILYTGIDWLFSRIVDGIRLVGEPLIGSF